MRKWLVDAREAKRFTQVEVSRKAKISQPTYHCYEQGTRNPRPKTAKRIASILGFKWTKFFDDD